MAQLTDKDRQSIEAVILAGNKIEAIKLYRSVIPGAGLADAKTAVEAMESQLRAAQPEKFTAPAKKGGCVGILVFLIFALAGSVIAFAWLA
ncbi:MAG: hypothetical protein EXS33_04480 [Pedosphaera sp.]|nr:hypothetical protein [Pedosphaera sp.]